MWRQVLIVFACLALAGTMTPGFGSPVVVTNYNDWASATTVTGSQDFETVGLGSFSNANPLVVSPLTFSPASGWGYVTSDNDNPPYYWYDWDSGRKVVGPDGFVLNMLIGVDVLSVGLNFGTPGGGNVTVKAYTTGDTLIWQDVFNVGVRPNYSVVGLTSDPGVFITRLSFTAPGTEYVVLDNIYYGNPGGSPPGGDDPPAGGETPELATALLMAAGLMTLGYMNRTRLQS